MIDLLYSFMTAAVLANMNLALHTGYDMTRKYGMHTWRLNLKMNITLSIIVHVIMTVFIYISYLCWVNNMKEILLLT